ncbi:SusD/RagB family nutrient-binding outer membrane lipoprotein [Polaribacter cellanae]|uniref:SusD/RagB family nutrient-binding outer membrane lipoprotein n=1 Tax=Polaribacter cellanae TaxID=2818493 RepID=A0A975CPY4_9FLAO|nr:SusD/RagB family nutrient-binding outer membrane lipoprotein [Polaribacter cellanae]QTE23976.1 SusD/RagB family nutrient-binding outer membrane lipoprotein [Polaribacter cellanae]
MKKNIILLLSTVFILLFSACDVDADINKNPNGPEIAPTGGIFNSAVKEYLDRSRSGFTSGRLTLPWMQYWGQTAYADEDRYLYRESTAQSYYTTSYTVAQDLKSIIDININSPVKNENEIAISRIMLCYIFHQLTDTFGDIPYYSFGSDDADFQALDTEKFIAPIFASQQKIYADLLKELKEAAAQININKSAFAGGGDKIYNGNGANWKKFANSLTLRIANRLRGVDNATAISAINSAISSGVFTSNSDNAKLQYESTDANASPFWRAFLTRTDFAVTQPFVELLKGDKGNFGLDPRLFKMVAPKSASIKSIKEKTYTKSTNPADYVGIPYAFPLANKLKFTDYSFGSSNIIKPDYEEVLMEYAEVAFIISEHKNWDDTEYKNGVRASMERWGVPASEITSFLASLPTANEENVLNQKYIASYMQPHNAWAEYRRTGFPSTLIKVNETVTLDANQATSAGVTTYVFEPRVAGLTDLPFRLSYPQILQSLNKDNRNDAVVKLGAEGDTQKSKLYWDVN